MPGKEESFSLNDVYIKLSQRVSAYNAKLLLHTIKVGAGIHSEQDDKLNPEEAKSLCLELIKKGGPAFQVGKDLYSQVQ
ncbi:MAG: hypothetical protein H6625_02515 [Bdellovibrionaceae bacterium]|nr:hypothetical protein [Pseudobdellovibrionaceae bacterium]